MSNVTAFPSDNTTPQQALLQAEEELGTMDHVAVVYMLEGEDVPRLTCSSMHPVDLNFLGTALQHYSMRYLRE